MAYGVCAKGLYLDLLTLMTTGEVQTPNRAHTPSDFSIRLGERAPHAKGRNTDLGTQGLEVSTRIPSRLLPEKVSVLTPISLGLQDKKS